MNLEEIRKKLAANALEKKLQTNIPEWPSLTEEDILIKKLKNEPIFDNSRIVESAEIIIECPKCKSVYLHHMGVEMFARKEDSNTGEHVTLAASGVDSDKIFTIKDNSLSNNPSIRRGGILIHYYCEDCDGKSTWYLAQNKGVTLAGWCV